MTDTTQRLSISVVGACDTLCRALNEQKREIAGWNVAMLDLEAEAPHAEAVVIVDFDEPAARDGALAALDVQGFRGPILVVGGEGERRLGAESLSRPIRLGALIARLAACAAVSAELAEARLGPYEYVPSERLLRHGATRAVVRLTELEQRLLAYLAAEGGLVERERLLEQVWGYNTGADTHTVETHIWRLRQKVETDDPATRFIITEIGGYRLILPQSDEAA